MLWLLWLLASIPIIPTARRAFSFMRASYIDNNTYPWDDDDRLTTGISAIICGIFWPLTLLWFIVTTNPSKSQKEIKQEALNRADAIRRLEIENEQFQYELDQHESANRSHYND